MFFKAHPEGKIGYKQLSAADLGLGTSHQTHIGLFDGILTFLYDQQVEDEAMLIFNNESNLLDVYFDRIQNPDGTFRSPKIRKGERTGASLVTVIRDLAAQAPNCTWYLIWFGLESGMAVFYLFNSNMSDCAEVSRIIDLTRTREHISSEDARFAVLVDYLENIVNNSSEGLLEQLEVASQTGQQRGFRPFDVEKANLKFKETGKRGEELISNYLEGLKEAKQIFNYNWVNKDNESGLPYDFTIQTLNQSIIHIDVKTTSYKFEQPMIFSNQEIQFIKDTPNYHVFRVYDIDENQPHLRICENLKESASFVHSCIDDFASKINQKSLGIHSVKLLVSTTTEHLTFGPELVI